MSQANDILHRLFVDAKYLSDSMARFQGYGEIHISHDGARVMLKNYQELLALLQKAMQDVPGSVAKEGNEPPLQHPTNPANSKFQENVPPEKPQETEIERLETLRIKSMDQLGQIHSTEKEHLEQLHESLTRHFKMVM